jgi:hypothetical protein
VVFDDTCKDCLLRAVWVEVAFFDFWEAPLEDFTDLVISFWRLAGSVEFSGTDAKDLNGF